MNVDQSLTRLHEGSGMGLSLVKSILEMHGGDIFLNSSINEGSEFTITLPITVLDDTAASGRSEPSQFSHSNVERTRIEFSDIYSSL